MITDKEVSELLSEDSDKKMKKMNMLGQMTFGIVHDIGNSLQILRASSYMIRKGAPDITVTKNVDAIDAAVENMALMVERVLSFSNNSNDLVQEIDILTALDETIILSEYLVPPHITIDFQKPDKKILLMANLLELSQAVLNLIKNSVDAIEPMKREGLISISIKECFPWVEVKVKDNGCGIAPKHLEKVFDPLFTTREGGTGIGLANVWATVESHGGVVAVTSELGQGSEFTIMLPRK